MAKYSLVHLITNGEYSKPLVASQVFDQAEVQATEEGTGRPHRVSVWAVEPMRTAFDGRTRETLRALRQRAPHVDIRIIGGIGRLDGWPTLTHAGHLRRQLGAMPVVYHCRAESAAFWGTRLRQICPSDAVVLDVRGVWPLELLYDLGIQRPEDATGAALVNFTGAMDMLRGALADADGITTVSRPLRDWLVSQFAIPQDVAIVPCGVKAITGDQQRDRIRAEWNASNAVVLAYSGTTASYQHVDDLLLPFLRAALDAAPDVRAVLLSPELDRMRALADAAGLDRSRTIVQSHPQTEVATYLTGCDLGLLLRAPSPLNEFSQPTKLGEYLASGVAVAVEQGTGDVPRLVEEAGAGLAVVSAGRSSGDVAAEAARVVEWARHQGHAVRDAARRLAAAEFTWRSLTPRLRGLYSDALAARQSGRARTPDLAAARG